MSAKRDWLMVFVAGACEIACNRLLNSEIIAPLSMESPALRDIVYIAAGILPLLLILAAAQRSDIRQLGARATQIAPLLIVSGALLTGVWSIAASRPALVAGFACWELGHLWIRALFLLALCQMKSIRLVALCLCASCLVGSLGQWAFFLLPHALRLIMCALLPCIALAASYPLARQNLLALSQAGGLKAIECARPSSFVRPWNPAFCCLLVFNLVFGFTLALNCISGIPVDTSLMGMLGAVLVGIFILASRNRNDFADPLAILAALLVVTGLLCAVISLFLPLGATSNFLLRISDSCFTIISRLVIVGIGSRNQLGALRVIVIACIFSSSGTLAGTMLGHQANALMEPNLELAAAFLASLLISFVALAFLWLFKFSFGAVIFGIEPVVAAVPAAEPEESSTSIDDLCQHLGERYGLTKRETELCALLARGRNGRAISEQLTLSYNTVKTHVKHIYMKLDVHTQQELIDLVELEREAAVGRASV